MRKAIITVAPTGEGGRNIRYGNDIQRSILHKKGLLREPVHFQFVLGAGGGIPATIENLIFLTRQIPEGSTWSAFGIGRHHIPIMAASLLLGGDVRVGFEDNLYYSKGILAKSNAELVERAVRLAGEFGRELVTPRDVRNMFGLS